MDASERATVSFTDVAALFSEEEWDVLEDRQRSLYGKVMHEVHHVLLDLGYRIENSEVLFRIIRKEDSSRRCGPSPEGLGPDILLRINYQGSGSDEVEESERRVIKAEPGLLPKIKQEEDGYDTGDADFSQGQDGRPQHPAGLALDALYPMTTKEEAEDGGLIPLSGSSKRPASKTRAACKSRSAASTPEQSGRERSWRRKGAARPIKSGAALHDCDQNKQTEPKENEAPRHPRLCPERPPEEAAVYPISFQQRGQTFIICSVCGKTFCNNSSFQVHMRTHTGERPYRCTHCDKSFIRSSHLKIHLRTHTGERPYQCSQCDKSFRDNSSFARHQRIHTGEKPYQCSTCGKNFRKKSNLKDHQRTHTGERPYKCKHCDKSFHQRSNLRVHERNHHRDS